ncbi:hypothetical protein D3218_13105 [Aureimonas flava]|uniref:Tape measure protein N-terminal domain-containing protein n=1 Tax=Aureimonas flava TaxID=2320271 RepID=A0A3A1WLH2_9HYPH|nr:tape measure protein [Aureimonas flava]RIY00217.1 hypothetical protein D3218_13105 [Aureimonas flava]
MIVDELIAVLGFDLRGKGDLDQFNKGLENAEGNAKSFVVGLTKLAAAATAAFAAIGGISALGGGISSFISGATQTGRTFEELEVRLKALEGSSEGAKKAMDWIADFAVRTPLELQQVIDAYADMKAFGLDPTNGALQAVTDAMAATGGGAEKLGGITLALGQAWTKQKLQGEEAMQLLERGVPVWDLLSQGLGKTVAEVQELSSKGKLGRKEIQLLIDMIGKRYAGASEDYARTFSGILSNLSDNWTRFLRTVADGGYYEDIKRRLQGLLDFVNAGWADGTFERIGQRISRVMVRSMDIAAHVATQAYRIGRGFYYAADAIVSLTAKISGLPKAFAAAGIGAGLIASSALGRGTLMAIARRVPAIAALLVMDDIISGLSGDKSMTGAMPGGEDALQHIRDQFAEVRAAADELAGTLNGVFGINVGAGQGQLEAFFAAAKDFAQGRVVQAFNDFGDRIGYVADALRGIALAIQNPEEAMTRFVDAAIAQIDRLVAAIDDSLGGALTKFGLIGEIKVGPALPPTLSVGGGAGKSMPAPANFDADGSLTRDGMVQAEGLKRDYGVDPSSLADAASWAAKAISSVQAFLEPAAAAKSALMDLERTVQARADLDINPILQKVEQAKDAIRSLQTVGMVGTGGHGIAPTRTQPNAIGGT